MLRSTVSILVANSNPTREFFFLPIFLDIAKDGDMDKVEFVVCSEDEDTDTASSEDDYSDIDSDFENH